MKRSEVNRNVTTAFVVGCATLLYLLPGCATAQRAVSGLIGGTARTVNTATKSLLPVAREADAYRVAHEQAKAQRKAQEEAEREQKRLVKRLTVRQNYSGAKSGTQTGANAKPKKHVVIDATPGEQEAKDLKGGWRRQKN